MRKIEETIEGFIIGYLMWKGVYLWEEDDDARSFTACLTYKAGKDAVCGMTDEAGTNWPVDNVPIRELARMLAEKLTEEMQ